MRQRLASAAKRVAGTAGSALYEASGRRRSDGFGILMYHRVAPVVRGIEKPPWNVPPRQFRRQVEGLLEAGYRIWPLRRLIAAAESGRALPEKITAITFDDGYASVYLEALPVLESLALPATVFVATAYVGSAAPFPFDEWGSAWHGEALADTWRPLHWGECRVMEATGLIEIGTHTHIHRDFRGDPAALYADLERSIRRLGDELGRREPLFAFPYGAPELGFAAPELLGAAREAGVRCALTTEGAMVRQGSSPFGWGRFEVTAADTGSTLAAKLAGFYDWMGTAKRCFVRLSPPPYLARGGATAKWSMR
ncbi:MAG TPA: polysaccharide deacetylase family protein [Thermoanaerobaculia bacterium]|nr:polysaccharide deacetylase family protein [Thermoanaerobaculia bacterium]